MNNHPNTGDVACGDASVVPGPDCNPNRYVPGISRCISPRFIIEKRQHGTVSLWHCNAIGRGAREQIIVIISE